MDALIASAGPIHKPRAGPSRPRKAAHKTVDRGPDKEAIDPSTHSILGNTRLPSSFHHSSLPTGSADAPIKPEPSVSKIKDKKLRAKVARNDVSSKRARVEREEVNEWLNAPMGGAGEIEVDDELGEKTWRVGQEEIVREVGVASAQKKFDLRFEDMGDYTVDYTRNGRHLAIASSRGHVATFDWQAGKLHSEIQLRETVRDIKWVTVDAFSQAVLTLDSSSPSRFTPSRRRNTSSSTTKTVSSCTSSSSTSTSRGWSTYHTTTS